MVSIMSLLIMLPDHYLRGKLLNPATNTINLQHNTILTYRYTNIDITSSPVVQEDLKLVISLKITKEFRVIDALN